MTVLIDYDAGNVFSVTAALERLGEEVVLTDDPSTILSADHVVFPGVGHAAAAMEKLEERGLVDVLCAVKAPFLGICLGGQLMLSSSDEGPVRCLGLVPGRVMRFDKGQVHRIPQIGWNQVHYKDSPLFEGIRQDDWFFFDHSYYMDPDEGSSLAVSQADAFTYSSVIVMDNFFGVQFHPEKSGRAGARLLANFLEVR